MRPATRPTFAAFCRHVLPRVEPRLRQGAGGRTGHGFRRKVSSRVAKPLCPARRGCHRLGRGAVFRPATKRGASRGDDEKRPEVQSNQGPIRRACFPELVGLRVAGTADRPLFVRRQMRSHPNQRRSSCLFV
jgi:hypothetical protein